VIFELCSETQRPGTLPEALRRCAAAWAARVRHSTPGGIWSSEAGALNRIVHAWPYADAAECGRVRHAVAQEGAWPPLDDLRVHAEAQLFTPLPGPMLQPGRTGPIYELRSYFVKPGDGVARYIAGWEDKLAERLALSPLAVAGYADVGPLSRIVQLWPYASLARRAEVRRVAVETGVLPPPGALDVMVSQENAILLPAPFSPMQ
jgi:hypothetical protein